MPSAEYRFWSNIACDEEQGCWVWLGTIRGGYGRLKIKGRSVTAHRYAYEMLRHTTVSPALHVDHLCRNKQCVNPLHLEPVTAAENKRRANMLITHCPKGHEYSAENTYIYKGRRFCRECNRIAASRYNHTKRKWVAA